MNRSAPFPGANPKLDMSPEQASRATQRLQEIDDRGRLYITMDEQVEMLKVIGIADLQFGANRVWLRPRSPDFLVMFNFVTKMRTDALKAKAEEGAK